MSKVLSQNLQQSIAELANTFLLVCLIFLGLFAVYTIWHMRVKKMREYKRKRRFKEDASGEKMNITSALPDLSKDEMKKIALEEKAKKEEEVIDMEHIDGLPLKPKVYFDTEKDPAGGDEPSPEPKIVRSFLSNEPLPKFEESLDKLTVEDESDAGEALWGSVEIDPEEAEEDTET